ncbi:MAG: tetratricopeptide repeat protein [Chloroflexia bacterium]
MLEGSRRQQANEHYERGLALERAGLVDEAIAEYRRAVDVDPGFAEAYEALGHHYQRRGLLVKALDAFRTAARLQDDYTAYFNLGYVLVELENYEEALEAFQKCLEFIPDDPAALYEIGYIHYARGNFAQALETLRLPQEAYPEDARVHSLMGACYLGLHRWAEAEASYRHALELASSSDEAEEAEAGLLTALRYQEFPPEGPWGPKEEAYAEAGVVVLGTSGDDGIRVPLRAPGSLSLEAIAVTLRRLRALVRGLGIRLTAIVAIERTSVPVATALERLLHRPRKTLSTLADTDRPLLVLANSQQMALLEVALDQCRGQPQSFVLVLGPYSPDAFLPDWIGVPASGPLTLPWEGTQAEPDATAKLVATCMRLRAERNLQTQVAYYAQEHRRLRFLWPPVS